MRPRYDDRFAAAVAPRPRGTSAACSGTSTPRASRKNRPSNHIEAPSILPGAETSAKSWVRRCTRSPGNGRTASTVKVRVDLHLPDPALPPYRNRERVVSVGDGYEPEAAVDGSIQDHAIGGRERRDTGSDAARASAAKVGERRAETPPAHPAQRRPHRRLVAGRRGVEQLLDSPQAERRFGRGRCLRLARQQCAHRGERGQQAQGHHGKNVQARAPASPAALVKATAVCRPGFSGLAKFAKIVALSAEDEVRGSSVTPSR